ncbi:MAG: hypothetical protein GYB36_13400 [Alphaproteobacteria bacterium]|nr:hypothetical protein [Alphaproteobacteria bacterium]
MKPLFALLIVTALLVAGCTTRRAAVDYQNNEQSVDRAIEAANDNSGSMRLTLRNTEMVMIRDVQRQRHTVCGFVYDRSMATDDNVQRDECFALSEVRELQVYEEHASVQNTVQGAAATVLYMSLMGFFALGCIGSDNCGPSS